MTAPLLQTGWPALLLTTAASIPILCGLWKLVMRLSNRTSSPKEPERTPSSALGTALTEQLSTSVFSDGHAHFKSSVGSFWSKQQRDIIPECVVKPRNEEEVSIAVRIIKKEFDKRLGDGKSPPTFAVRSGGHSTIPGASNTAGGIVIDLSLLNQIELSEDRESVSVGSGVRWGDVSRKLDNFGLAVVGGRNSDVGVGGLTLGGGYSYFSPQHGFVCDNVLEYRIVLASGAITIASEEQNPQLWRALKGGSNNFGIVTCFKFRAFPCSDVWSGFLYMFSWKAPQVITAFHETINGPFDPAAGGPLLCISYVQKIGIQVIATHLMYAKAQPWPACYQRFKKIGRVWSSTKFRSLTSTTDELDSISPAGFRQLHISTTVKNDLATLFFVHAVYSKKTGILKKVKGMVWTLVLQPLHKSTMTNGEHNVFGLRERDENLAVILFTAVWERESDDTLVYGSGRSAIEKINDYAAERGTADKFRYFNWSDGTQRPFQSYGEDSMRFLKHMSKQVDPDGLFQRGCIGGHKLMNDG